MMEIIILLVNIFKIITRRKSHTNKIIILLLKGINEFIIDMLNIMCINDKYLTRRKLLPNNAI